MNLLQGAGPLAYPFLILSLWVLAQLGWLAWQGGAYAVQPAGEGENGPTAVLAPVFVGEGTPLSGRLLFVEQRGAPYARIARLDFATQTISTVFQIPRGALVYQIAKTPNPQILGLSYSPPATGGEPPYSRNGIYTLNLADGTVAPLLGADTEGVYYTFPHWTEGALYYQISTQGDKQRRIERYDLETGAITRIAEDAALPVVAPDGGLVAYLRVHPETQAWSLWVTDPAGQRHTQLVGEMTFPDIDHPLFSPDGAWIYFSALEGSPPTMGASGWDWVWGVSSTLAHGNHSGLSRWYRIAVAGGQPEVVTMAPAPILYADIYGDTLGFANDTGFYIAHHQSNAQVLQARTIRSFVWLP